MHTPLCAGRLLPPTENLPALVQHPPRWGLCKKRFGRRDFMNQETTTKDPKVEVQRSYQSSVTPLLKVQKAP